MPKESDWQPGQDEQGTPRRRARAWQRGAAAFVGGLGRTWEQFLCGWSNSLRRLRRGRLPDYVVIVLDHAVSERAPVVPWYYAYLPGLKLPLSLEYLHKALRRVAGDPDVRGVVFLMRGPSLSLAQAQSLAQLFDRFRAWDSQWRRANATPKQVIVHLEQVGAAAYVVACAADRITMPPQATWDVMGLRAAPTFWKETLDRVGIAFDVVKIAPWKTAADALSRRDMSDAARDQTNWLLDSLYADIIAAISRGRKLKPEAVTAQLDCAPLSADQALTAGLIDAIAYEDELADLLAVGQASSKPARLKPYAQVRGILYRRPRRAPAQHIGVLTLEGAIVTGESRSFPLPLPLVGDKLMGSATVEQQIRAARLDRSLAAVVVHVDSGGGSALASDLIARELMLLNQEKPVVVYMGDVAASGGYYIATPGRSVVAQSATITGSIGVIVSKGSTEGLRAKIGANREVIRRGANAGLFNDDRGWTDAQQQTVTDMVRHTYDIFKQRVADGRKLPLDGLDEICSGKVWTGKQALQHGLIDALGDFQVALGYACRAAGLPDDGSVRTRPVQRPRARLMPERPDPRREDAAAWVNALLHGEWLRLMRRDPVWLMDPDLPRLDCD